MEMLDQLADAVVCDGLGAAGRSEHAYCFVHRLSLPFCNMTLEDVCASLGITRERARQIENRILARRSSAGPFFDGGLLDRAIDTLTYLDFYDEVPKALIVEGLTKDSNWDLKALLRLASLMNADHQLLRIHEIDARMTANSMSVKLLQTAIDELRDANGLISKQVLFSRVPKAMHLGEKIFEQLRANLNFAEHGDLVLAPKSKNPSIRSAFYSQLSLAPEFSLTPEEVVEGARRRQRSRGKGLNGTSIDTAACVAALFPEFQFDQMNRMVRLVEQCEPSFDDEIQTDSMIQFVYRQEGYSAHVYDVIADAIDKGQNITSVGIYLNYEPRIRTVDNIVSIVGRSASPQLTEKLKRRAALVYQEGRQYLDIDINSLRGTFQLNPLWVRSGYWYIPSGLNQLLGLSLSLECCLCTGNPQTFRIERPNATGRFSINTNFTNHLVVEHRIGSMRSVPIRILGDTMYIGR